MPCYEQKQINEEEATQSQEAIKREVNLDDYAGDKEDDELAADKAEDYSKGIDKAVRQEEGD